MPASIPSRSENEAAIEKLTWWLTQSPRAVEDHALVLEAVEADLAQRGEPGFVVKGLAPLKAVFRIENGEAEGRLFWAVYEALLVDVPPWALRAGAKAYAKDPKSLWFPRPAQILDAAHAAMAPLQAARYRLVEAKRRAEELQRRKAREPITPEMREQLAQDLRSMTRSTQVQTPRSGETQAQMAERLRAAAETEQRA